MADNKPQRTELKDIGKFAAISKLLGEENIHENNILLDTKSSFVADSEKNSGKRNAKSSVVTAVANKVFFEGIDFDLTYMPLKYLGYKTALSVIGELYAENTHPTELSYTIGLSAKFSFEHLQTFWDGVAQAALDHSANKEGQKPTIKLHLDLTPSLTGLVISCVGCGSCVKKIEAQERAINENTVLCISGNLGAAYMGLHVLEREKVAFNANPDYKQPDLKRYRYILGEYLTPQFDSDTIRKFEEKEAFPTKTSFITKGLADAVKRIVAGSNFGAKIYLEKVPIASQTREMAEEIGVEPITAIMNGGDDYRFLYAFDLEQYEKIKKDIPEMEIIGHLYTLEGSNNKDEKVRGEEHCYLITPEGNSITIKAQGWDL